MSARLLIVLAFLLNILNLGTVLKIDRFSVIERLMFLAAAIVFAAGRRRDPAILAVMLLVVAYTAGAGAMTSFPQFNWSTYFLAINQFLIIYIFLYGLPDAADRRAYFWLIMLLPSLSVVVGLMYAIAQVKPLFAIEFGTGKLRLAGSLIPAFLSAYAMCGMFASARMAGAERKAIFVALFAVNLVILLLAGGRSPLAVGLLMSFMILLTSRELRSDYKLISVVSGCVVVAVALLTVGQNVLRRFVESGNNGREVIWKYTLDLADRYPWTGIGFGHQFWSMPRIVKVTSGTTAAHNDFIRLVCEIGYPGVVMFYLALFAATLRCWWRGDHSATMWIGFFGFMAMSLTDNTLASPNQYILLILASFASSPEWSVREAGRLRNAGWRMVQFKHTSRAVH